jgi:hypothetical protein
MRMAATYAGWRRYARRLCFASPTVPLLDHLVSGGPDGRKSRCRPRFTTTQFTPRPFPRRGLLKTAAFRSTWGLDTRTRTSPPTSAGPSSSGTSAAPGRAAAAPPVIAMCIISYTRKTAARRALTRVFYFASFTTMFASTGGTGRSSCTRTAPPPPTAQGAKSCTATHHPPPERHNPLFARAQERSTCVLRSVYRA